MLQVLTTATCRPPVSITPGVRELVETAMSLGR
jgi:hypothetical protein